MIRVTCIALLVLAGCANPGSDVGPPRSQLYFPAGLQHVKVAGSTNGVLFVVNENINKRYGTASLVGLRLDDVGLPALGGDSAAVVQLPALGPVQDIDGVQQTGVRPEQVAQIGNFGAELGISQVGDGHYRLYVPTHSELNQVFRVDAVIGADGVPQLSCVGGDAGLNCLPTGVTLTPREFQNSTTGLPRAPAPYGVASAPRTCSAEADCCNDGATSCGRTCEAGFCKGNDGLPFNDVYFTHLAYADSPLASNLNLNWFLVRMDSDNFGVDLNSYINIGAGGSNSVMVKGKWAYVTGRVYSPQPNLLRLVSRDRRVLFSGLESYARVGDARSIAPSTDGRKLYVVGRAPDMLMVFSLDDSNPDAPSVGLERLVPLPDAPNQLQVIARPGKSDLVVVSCTSGGSLAIFDEGISDYVALVQNIGFQPFGVAVDHRGTGARIYVSNTGDGRIAVIDIADLNQPQNARLVAHIGAQQLCLTRGVTSPGCLSTGGAQ